jgi:hypothetical protein
MSLGVAEGGIAMDEDYRRINGDAEQLGIGEDWR